MNYRQTLEHLYNRLPVFHRIGAAAYKDNLLNTTALDNYFGSPHRSFRSIHVAGTNGKGSVSQMIYEALRADGHRVGLYTSPHLVDFRERIVVDGQMISQDDVVDFVARHEAIIEELNPSFFELTVAMAFDYFRAQGVDYAVVEVGMGGRLDSTNIITPELCVITNIDFDHTQFLGDTLPKIAAEKGGIIKRGVPVVVGETNVETAPIFTRIAAQVDAEIIFADQKYRCERIDNQNYTLNSTPYRLAMEGDYQSRNLCTAVAALELLSVSPRAIACGLERARVAGRWQILADKPLTICDTAHNPAGMRYVLAQIARQKYQRLIFIIGMVGDKDVSTVLAMLPADGYYIFTRAALPRAMAAAELAERASWLRGEVVDNVTDSYRRACEIATADDMIFIGGSTFVVAELLTDFFQNETL